MTTPWWRVFKRLSELETRNRALFDVADELGEDIDSQVKRLDEKLNDELIDVRGEMGERYKQNELDVKFHVQQTHEAFIVLQSRIKLLEPKP